MIIVFKFMTARHWEKSRYSRGHWRTRWQWCWRTRW